MRKKTEIEQLVNDLVFIKQAIKKNNNIFKYFSVSKALRWVLLYAGLIIISIALYINYLFATYDSFQGAPTTLKVITYIIAVVGIFVLVVIKLRTIVKAAKGVQSDITVIKMIKEVYTGQTLMIMIPFFIAIALLSVFFHQQGLGDYIIPFAAILFGLLINSLVNVFHIKEMLVMGDWLIITGFIALFFLSAFNPALIIALTFGMGCVAMYLAILIASKQEEE